ncbi:hypothetical protein CVT26_004630 [Gymnopilus dilepis]|uniref:Uncharacterized protein n=1 Tax=Gymnopilus dilepis TaxID=231916 RepID=A0A409YTJ7_9AGAR|nr:hypothetical protein CVT26_004630 [Gymnopilus dilepis]
MVLPLTALNLNAHNFDRFESLTDSNIAVSASTQSDPTAKEPQAGSKMQGAKGWNCGMVCEEKEGRQNSPTY